MVYPVACHESRGGKPISVAPPVLEFCRLSRELDEVQSTTVRCVCVLGEMNGATTRLSELIRVSSRCPRVLIPEADRISLHTLIKTRALRSAHSLHCEGDFQWLVLHYR